MMPRKPLGPQTQLIRAEAKPVDKAMAEKNSKKVKQAAKKDKSD
jgi:hypothetical protein